MPVPFQNVAGTPTEPQFAEIVLKGHSIQSDTLERPFVNILHFKRTLNVSNSDESALFDALDTALSATFMAALSEFYVGDFTRVRFMDDPMRAAIEVASLGNGLVEDDRAPNFDAVVTRKICGGARGRSFKGSNHWGPIAESSTTKDRLSIAGAIVWSAFNDALNGIAQDGLSASGGDLWKLIVLSPTLSNLTANPSVFTGAYVTETLLNLRIGSMNRRKEKAGVS